MSEIVTQRRNRQKANQQQAPLGTIAMIATACVVTLIGVFSGIEPFDILIRTSVSALAMGLLVTVGASIVRVAGIRKS